MLFILKFCGQFGFSSSFVNVTDFSNLKNLATQILECESFICKPCQREKLLIYFDVKRCLELKCI